MKARLKKLSMTQRFWSITGSSALLASIISLGVGMRQSIWFDEAYSLLVARQSPTEIVRLAGLDTHPPLYYLLLHGWGSIFHWDVFWLRLLSVIALAASIVVMGILLKRLFGARVAAVAVVVVALSPLLLRYGFEIRMYSLASLIGVTATYAMVRANEQHASRRWWIMYAVLVAVGMYTLYYLALLWVAHAVWMLMRVIRSRKRDEAWYRWPWLWAYGGAVALFLPWLPTFLRQTTNGALAPIGQPMTADTVLGVASFNLLYQPLWQLDMIHSILYLMALVAAIFAVSYAWRHATRQRRSSLLLLAAYIGVPIGVLVVVSFARSMYVERYLSHVAIGLMALVGISLGLWLASRSRQALLGAGVIILALLVGCGHLVTTGNYNFQRMSRPDVKGISEVATSTCRDKGAIVAADPYVAIELMAYASSTCPIYFFSDSAYLGGGYAPLNGSPNQLTSKQVDLPYERLYYVYYDTPQLALHGEPRGTIDSDNLHVTIYR